MSNIILGVYARTWIENGSPEYRLLIGYCVLLCVHPPAHLEMYKYHTPSASNLVLWNAHFLYRDYLRIIMESRRSLSDELCNSMARYYPL